MATAARQRAQAKTCKCGAEILTRSNRCSPCSAVSNKALQEKRILEGWSKSDVYNYRWREVRPKAYILQNAKGRAKKKGWDFNLTEDDFEIPEFCPVLGLKLELVCNKGTKDNKPSLDRIDSSKGYIRGNVQIISWRANNLKSNGTLAEFQKLVEFLSGNKS